MPYLKVRAYLDVTITVPHTMLINERDYIDWAESQPEPATYDAEQIERFIRSDDSDEWVREFPAPDAHEHEVADYVLTEVELIGRSDAAEVRSTDNESEG